MLRPILLVALVSFGNIKRVVLQRYVLRSTVRLNNSMKKVNTAPETERLAVC